MNPSLSNKLPIVVLISGNGSNLQAIIDETKKNLPVIIKAVMSDRHDAYGLKRAAKEHIPTEILSPKRYKTRKDYDQALQQCIDKYMPKLVVLAGFMRILGDDIVKHYEGHIINIHPSLLPKYPGLNTHTKVLEAGDKEHGTTIHFVTHELDSGPIIARRKLTVAPHDTAKTLERKVKDLEHTLYPEVIRWYAVGRLRLQNNRVLLDGDPIDLL